MSTHPPSDPGAPDTDTEHAPIRFGMSRRAWMLTVSGVTLFALLGIAFWLPVPFVRLAPGPTFNVVGQEDGQPVISISGAKTYPVAGELDMTTVLESGGPRGGLTFATAIAAWFNPSDAVVPRELLFPDDVTGDEVRTRQAMLFSTSESNAIAAAMGYLGEPVTADIVVTAVYPDTPADGLLQAKDRVVSVNGTPVTATEQVVSAIQDVPSGSTVTFEVERDGTPTTVPIVTRPDPDDPDVPYVGIGLGPLYSAAFPVSFSLEHVGGPSAGLMFALGIVAKLSPADLTFGQHVAGTGTIEADGSVGPIGGIRQKLAGARNDGATLFLLPAQNCAEAAGHVPDGLTAVPVQTLAQAVSAIDDYAAGRPLAECPAPAAE